MPAPYGFMRFPIDGKGLDIVRSSILTGGAKITDEGILNNPASGMGVLNLGIAQVTTIGYGSGRSIASVDYHRLLFKMLASTLPRFQRLITIGYSFGDDHVNDVIGTWIRNDRARVIEIIDPFLFRLIIIYLKLTLFNIIL